MPDQLHIGAHEDLKVVRDEADAFEVEATYLPHGNQPPPHLHPAQDEDFAVLRGTLRVRMDGQTRDISRGEEFTVPRRHVHCMWNAGDEPALVRWRTTPALSTAQWFAGLDALQRQAEERGKTRPDLLGFAAHARANRDTFRLVLGGSDMIGSAVVGALGTVARIAGRGRG